MNCSFAPAHPGAESAARPHTFSIGPVAKNRLIRMLWEVRAPATIFPFAGRFSVLATRGRGKLIVFISAITKASSFWLLVQQADGREPQGPHKQKSGESDSSRASPLGRTRVEEHRRHE